MKYLGRRYVVLVMHGFRFELISLYPYWWDLLLRKYPTHKRMEFRRMAELLRTYVCSSDWRLLCIRARSPMYSGWPSHLCSASSANDLLPWHHRCGLN